MSYKEDTICGVFYNQAQRFGDSRVFLMARFDNDGEPSKEYHSMTWTQARHAVMGFAGGLITLGVKTADKVAIFAESRPKWIVSNLAIMSCGAVEVPLYGTLTEDELFFMLENSESSVVIVSDRKKARMALKAKEKNPKIKDVICMCVWEGQRPEGLYTFNEVIAMGYEKTDMSQVEERIAALDPGDTASIIYTSGTTGRPKGAMLSHANWVANMHQSSASTLMRREAKKGANMLHLVHLPLCHVFGRTADYHVGALVQGGTLAFETDFSRIAKTMQELRPNVIISIPRLFEKIYDTIHSVVSRQNKLAGWVFAWAFRQGDKFADAMSRGVRLSILDLTLFGLANLLVFNRIRSMAGMDRLVLAISGGGKLSKEVCVFIRSLGIQLAEGYGLTETTPVINFNEPEFRDMDTDNTNWWLDKMIDWTVDVMVLKQAKGKSPYTSLFRLLKLVIAYESVAYRLQIKPGAVGRTVKWTEEKLAPDGELLVKGPQVFKGYWKLPKETKEAFTPDGWFMTGDIGEWDKDGFLSITDRKKELFVTSGGKNIAPHPIELVLISMPYIEQACLTGDGRKYLTALIVPDIKELKRFAKTKGIPVDDMAAMMEHPEVKTLMSDQVDQVNNRLAGYEQVKYFRVLNNPFSVEGGELTPTMKMKRRIINDRYKGKVEEMYK
ncbi:MAG: long-chain fatty acid--CoA ligase [Thermodesulfobacteriota bacterium]|nr:long-chain fatty acid--CoA ligase [Thermodesulfobacteriota bacterium]